MSRKISMVQFHGAEGTFLRTEYPSFNRVEYMRLKVQCVGRPVMQFLRVIAAAKRLASLFVNLLIQIVRG